MAKDKNPLVKALEEGRSYQLELPEGGDLATFHKC